MVPLPPIPPRWVVREATSCCRRTPRQRRRRLLRAGCLVVGIAGLACQPGVLLPPPDVPEVHLTFQGPAESFHHARGPTFRTVVEQPK